MWILITLCLTQFGSFNFFRVIFLIASRAKFCWKLQLHWVSSLLYLPSILCFFNLSDLSLVCLKLCAWRCCSIYISSALLCRCKNSPTPPNGEEGGERELWWSRWSIDEPPDLTQVPVPSLNLDSYPIPADIYRIWYESRLLMTSKFLENVFNLQAVHAAMLELGYSLLSFLFLLFLSSSLFSLCRTSFTLPTRFSPPAPRLQIEFTAQCIFDRD